MKSKMTIEDLAQIIERTVAKKEDIDALRSETKKDILRLETAIAQLSTKHDRLHDKFDMLKEMVEETDKRELNLEIRFKKLEKHAFVGA